MRVCHTSRKYMKYSASCTDSTKSSTGYEVAAIGKSGRDFYPRGSLVLSRTRSVESQQQTTTSGNHPVSAKLLTARTIPNFSFQSMRGKTDRVACNKIPNMSIPRLGENLKAALGERERSWKERRGPSFLPSHHETRQVNPGQHAATRDRTLSRLRIKPNNSAVCPVSALTGDDKSRTR